MHQQSLKLLCSTAEKMHLQDNTLFDLWVKVTQKVSQFPLHHATYAPAKFEVAACNCLGEDTFTENTLFDL